MLQEQVQDQDQGCPRAMKLIYKLLEWPERL